MIFPAWGSCGLTSHLPPAGLACSLGGYRHPHHHITYHHHCHHHHHHRQYGHHQHHQRMCSETSGSSEEDKPIFQPLTRDSLAQIQVRMGMAGVIMVVIIMTMIMIIMIIDRLELTVKRQRRKSLPEREQRERLVVFSFHNIFCGDDDFFSYLFTFDISLFITFLW